MKNKTKEPPQFAIRFANTVFALGILFSLLITAYASYRIFNPIYAYNFNNKGIETFYIISMLSGCVFALLFGLGLKRLNNNLKVNLTVLFFSIGIAVYGFETYLEFFKKTQTETREEKIKIKKAKLMGVPYDTRTKKDVLGDLRNSGIKIFPNIFPWLFDGSNGLTTKKGRIYPLGTISNSTTIFTKEGGFYPIIETDEHGFNNPKGLYNKNKVDIILTGDSFTEGYSVHADQSISAVLRKLDFNAISIGKRSSGPLIELAALKEYAEPLEPKIVLWLYFVNDIFNLQGEMKSLILKKYLNEDDYSQNLISRQEEIDSVLINYVQVKLEEERERERRERERISNKSVIKISKLFNLRKRINLIPTPKPTLKPTPTSMPTPIFRDILQKSKQMVFDWGGKMYFVYLPDFERYSTGSEHPNRDFVIQTITELNIPIIDLHWEVFDPHPDPLSLFPFRMWGHYNAEGYKLIAEAIGKRLETDGYVPIKSKK